MSATRFGPAVLRTVTSRQLNGRLSQPSRNGRSGPFLTDDLVLGSQEIGRGCVGPGLQRRHLVVGRLGHEQPDCRERPGQDVPVAVVEHEPRGRLRAVGFAGVVQPVVVQQSVVEDLIGRRSTDVGKAGTDEHEVIDRSQHRHDGDDDPRARGPDEDHTSWSSMTRSMWEAHSSAVVPSKSRGSKSTDQAVHRLTGKAGHGPGPNRSVPACSHGPAPPWVGRSPCRNGIDGFVG